MLKFDGINFNFANPEAEDFNMNKFVILPDITCDISEEIRSYFGLEDYLCGHINIDGENEIDTRLDWSLIACEDFYRILSDKKRKITTAPPNIDEYYAAFEHYVKDGYAILSMSISSKISSTYSISCTAADRIKESYPDAVIYNIDTYRMSGAFGLLVCYACDLKRSGKSIEEIVAWLEDNKNCVHQMGPIDDLMFVARRGRITMGKAIMGSFAGVKPMGDCNADGYVSTLTKTKGIKKALELTVAYMRLTAVDIENNYVIISQSDRREYGETLKAMIEKELKPKKVFMTDVFSGCGANIGPGMIAAYYFGNPVSDDMSAEKEVIARITGK